MNEPNQMSAGAAAARPPMEVPSAWTAVTTLASVTFTRLRRGVALWLGLVFAALPIAYPAVSAMTHSAEPSLQHLLDGVRLLLAVLPAMFVASSIGEDIEHKTSTYLWSRPIPRWGVIAGKLLALVPTVAVLVLASWVACFAVARQTAPPVDSCIALVEGSIAASLIAAGIATLVPSYALVLTIGYMLVDMFISALPMSLAELSITHQVTALAQLSNAGEMVAPLVWLIGVSGLWLVIAVVRINRLEV
jgi:ABC-type transport system involved in multi-copper enzyme maturation permease subunit